MECRQHGFDLVDNFHGIRTRLAIDRQLNAAYAVVPGGRFVILHAVHDMTDIGEAHGRAIAIGDDQRGIVGSRKELPGGLYVHRLVRSPQRACGQTDVALGERLLHFVYADLPRGHRLGIDLHAHGVFLAAKDLYLRDPVDGGDALRHQCLRELIHGGKRHRGRSEHQEEHRGVGRIEFTKRRRRRHVLRKTAAGLRDGSLDVLRRAVNIAAQDELQGNVGSAQKILGGHRVQTGNRGELLLKG